MTDSATADLRLLVATHKPYSMPAASEFLPLQVGVKNLESQHWPTKVISFLKRKFLQKRNNG